MPKPQGYRVALEKNMIRIFSTCHDELLVETKGQDLNKDHALLIDEAEYVCRYCKKDAPKIPVGEIQLKVFDAPAAATPPAEEKKP